jgi:hypothetical protein
VKDKINIVLNIWQKFFFRVDSRGRGAGQGRAGQGREEKGKEYERERKTKKSGAVSPALQFCSMPTQRWRWRPWRVLRQATGAVEAVPPDTGHLIPRLLFFYRCIRLLPLPLDLSWLAVTDIHDSTASSSFFFFLSPIIYTSFFCTISLML